MKRAVGETFPVPGAGAELCAPARVNDSPGSGSPALARPKQRAWLAFSGALSLLLIIFAVAISVVEWRKQVAATDSELQSAAEMGSRAVDAYFDSLQVSLKVLRESLPDMNGRSTSIGVKQVALHALGVFHATHPELRSVIVAGDDGQIWLVSGRPVDAPMPSIGADASFKAYRAAPFAEFDIGRPTFSRTTNEWIIPVRLAVTDASSQLRYFIGVGLPVDFIAGFWKNASIVSKASLSIVRDDGFLLSRFPNEKSIQEARLYGSPRTGSLMNHLRATGFPASGFASGLTSADGYSSRFAFRRLTHVPV